MWILGMGIPPRGANAGAQARPSREAARTSPGAPCCARARRMFGSPRRLQHGSQCSHSFRNLFVFAFPLTHLPGAQRRRSGREPSRRRGESPWNALLCASAKRLLLATNDSARFSVFAPTPMPKSFCFCIDLSLWRTTPALRRGRAAKRRGRRLERVVGRLHCDLAGSCSATIATLYSVPSFRFNLMWRVSPTFFCMRSLAL